MDPKFKEKRILRIDHISLATNEYEKAMDFFSKVLGAVSQSDATDSIQKYYWNIFKVGDLSRLEIIKKTEDGSFLDKFIENRKSGIHHITFQTPDIKKFKEFLDEEGIPYFGYKDYGESWKELFIHPKNAFGVLLQIGEFEADDWIVEGFKMQKGIKWSVEKIKDILRLTFAHPGGGKVEFELSHRSDFCLTRTSYRFIFPSDRLPSTSGSRNPRR